MLFEERLEGRELSVFAIADGTTMLPLAAACDYKRAGDGDRGPNTGGMGAYSPPAGFPDDALAVVNDRIIAPTLNGLRADGERYVGVLYCGLMWTARGPRVIEFNVRFGDPETQVLMPRVRGDFARLLESAAAGKLKADAASFADDACVGVTLATRDYPRTSVPLADLPPSLRLPDGVHAFWGASTLRGETVESAGGRVMTISATGATVAQARTPRRFAHVSPRYSGTRSYDVIASGSSRSTTALQRASRW